MSGEDPTFTPYTKWPSSEEEGEEDGDVVEKKKNGLKRKRLIIVGSKIMSLKDELSKLEGEKKEILASLPRSFIPMGMISPPQHSPPSSPSSPYRPTSPLYDPISPKYD